jgi:hypothetical protein
MLDAGVLARGNSGIRPTPALSLCNESGVSCLEFWKGGVSDLALQCFLFN